MRLPEQLPEHILHSESGSTYYQRQPSKIIALLHNIMPSIIDVTVEERMVYFLSEAAPSPQFARVITRQSGKTVNITNGEPILGIMRPSFEHWKEFGMWPIL